MLTCGAMQKNTYSNKIFWQYDPGDLYPFDQSSFIGYIIYKLLHTYDSGCTMPKTMCFRLRLFSSLISAKLPFANQTIIRRN